MAKYSKEELKKFINDPDWYKVEEIFLEYIEPLNRLENVNLNNEPETVKAEVRVRLELFKQVKTFLSDIGLLKAVLRKEPTTYK